MKSLDQVNHPAGACASHRALKLQNKSKFQGSILNELMEFASSVPDFRRSGKGNIRHRLDDSIMLLMLGRAYGCVGRADIIEFGRHNLNRFRKIGMLLNGVPSEPTLCRIEHGIDEIAMVDRIQAFAQAYYNKLLEDKEIEIICVRPSKDTYAYTLKHRRPELGTRQNRDPHILHL